MAEPQHDPGLLGWALGAVASAVAAAFTWMFNRMQSIESRLDARVTAAEASEKTHASTGDIRDLWGAITEDRKQASAFREATLIRLGEMPTKTDLRQMEDRLQAGIDRSTHR
jgi:hypothetical protein